MPVGATLGAAAIGAGASIYSSSKAAGAAKDAAAQNQANIQPYVDAGKSAISDLSNPNALLQGFQTSPNYNFTMQQGLNAVGTDKAVNGLLRSGSALKSLNTFAQGTAANQWNNYISQKQFLANSGNTANQQASTNNNNQAAAQGNSAIATGNAIGAFGGALAPILAKYGNDNSGGGSSSYQAASGHS